VILARELAGNVFDRLVKEGLGALAIAGLVGPDKPVISFGSPPGAFPAPPRIGGSASIHARALRDFGFGAASGSPRALAVRRSIASPYRCASSGVMGFRG
jgi:hypothetical protein